MTSVDLVLELPAHESADFDFPTETELLRTTAIGRASGLNGDQVLQLGVLVSATSLATLRVWLRTRAERLKHTRVIWNGREFHAYTADEVERLAGALHRALGEGGAGSSDSTEG